MDYTFRSAAAFEKHVAARGPVFGGWLDLNGCTGLTALPDGLSVGGWLDLNGCTGLTALPDGLSVGGGLYLPDHLCGDQTWRGESVTLQNIDGYTMVMERSYRSGDAQVWRARYFSGREVAEMKRCFIAKAGEHYAHGDTPEEAVDDAQEKSFEAADKTEVLSAIRARGTITQAEFRALTGACRRGLRHGLEERGVAPNTAEMPISEAVRIARGNRFGDRLIQLLDGA